MEEKQKCWGGQAQDDQSYGCQSEARSGVHQLRLQETHELAYKRIVSGVIALLPVEPIRGRLVVPLHHLHLMNPLPQNNHVLIHQPAPIEVLPVLLMISIFSTWRKHPCSRPCSSLSVSIHAWKWVKHGKWELICGLWLSSPLLQTKRRKSKREKRKQI